MKPNDKVICINGRKRPTNDAQYHFPNGFPVEGRIYVVNGEDPKFRWADAGPTGGIFLVGLRAIHRFTNIEVPWPYYRFRLLSELKAEAAAKAKQKQKQLQ